jgi:hypothetical protein
MRLPGRRGFLFSLGLNDNMGRSNKYRVETFARWTQPTIYCVQPSCGGPVKIGYSERPLGRLKELQACCPFPLQVLYLQTCHRDQEKLWHGVFEKERLHGEWFGKTNYVERWFRGLDSEFEEIPLEMYYQTHSGK